MRKALTSLAVLALGGLAVFWLLTRPETIAASEIAGMSGDAERGEAVFWAAGCVSCHSAPEAEGDDRLVLSGGRRFPSDFGTFIAPNISPDPEAGIGGWSQAEFLTAMQNGVSPDGRHYYPAFPYTAYRLADPQDLLDLQAFLMTLPASPAPSPPHEVGFPFNIRRTLGVWKLLYMPGDFAVAGDLPPEAARGRYLSEALAHCGECHTPRSALGGLDRANWLAGAPNPSGDGTIPALTPDELSWSESEIANYLRDGFTPDFDSAGGHMREVVLNLANLPDADRLAIAAYLKALPAAE